MNTAGITQDYIAPKVVAKKLGVSERTIYRKIKSGEIPSKKIGSKTLRVPISYLKK